jgi:hypothetical protein
MYVRSFEERNEQARIYLEQLRSLASEIDIAMGAIATNALTNLQNSIAKQENLCDSLAIMANAASGGVKPSEFNLPSSIDIVVEERIRATIDSIRSLNLQYSFLLKHSGRSIAVLSSLCRSHTGQFDDLGRIRSKRQTWSCEG